MRSDNLKNYLLGASEGSEIEDIDLRIISCEIPAEQLELAESELIEDYLEGNLSEHERRLFEDNFLVSGERCDQLEEIELLKKYAKSSEAASGVAEQYAIRDWFRFNFRPLTAALAVIAIGVVAFSGWRMFFTHQTSSLENEYAVLNVENLTRLSERNDFSVVELYPGTFRSSTEVKKIRSADLSESILFRLALPFDPPENTVFRADLLRNDNVEFTIEKIRTYRVGTGGEIRILLPRSVLKEGGYQIRLTNASELDSVVTYDITVE